MKDFFKIFLSYFKRHIMLTSAFFLIVIVFSVVFWAYSVPVNIVLYAAAISAFLLAILLVIRFTSYYKKHKILCEIKKRLDVSIDGLPDCTGIIDRDYTDIIISLNGLKNAIQSAADLKYSEMSDYYTLWAHQIKTPIAAARLLLQNTDDEKIEGLSEQLFKIEEYVEMVMQYLRTESMSSDIELKKYELGDLVKQAVMKYRKQFLRKNISLEVSNINATVLTDEKWLVFVIEQIISNSLKYTSYGKVSIYTDKASPKTLVISDTGIGIRPEDLPRVCERGFTGLNGRVDKKSTGIGLFLCKKILNKLSHSFTIDSAVDSGTVVKINLKSREIEIE